MTIERTHTMSTTWFTAICHLCDWHGRTMADEQAVIDEENEHLHQHLPLDEAEWHQQWDAWLQAHAADLQPTTVRFRGHPGHVELGMWTIRGVAVMLTESMNRDRSVRGIDITTRGWTGEEYYDGVFSWAALAEHLALTDGQ